MSRFRFVVLSVAFAVAALFSIVFTPGSALAAGSVVLENGGVLEEEDGRWKLKMKIDYGAQPEIQFIPLNFIFEQVVLYERTLTDESPQKPVLNKKQLVNQPTQTEGMEVGFSDGTGKMFKVTKFNFLIRRDRGFEAGEYMLTLKKADGGQQIGQKVRVTLKGDNKVVDRRAISFVGEKPNADKPKAKPVDATAGDSGEPKSDPPPDGASSGDPPPAVEPKAGGCGCRVGGERGSAGLGLLVGSLAIAFLARRRRPSRAGARFVQLRE